jgi:elongation factor G
LFSFSSAPKIHIVPIAHQLPIGLEGEHSGVVCLVTMKALYFEGPNGLERRTADIPAELLEAAKAKRHELLEAVSNVDDELADVFLADQARAV